MAITVKTNRIDFRIDDNSKYLLETAAKINHLSLTSYISSVVLKQAELDIKENERLILNEKDANLIMELLENEDSPNERLIRLMK